MTLIDSMSALNTLNPLVVVMEKEFEDTRKLLLQYTKLNVQSRIILNICNVILCLSMTFNIPLLIVTEILLNTFLTKSLKSIHKECNLNQVGKIVFGKGDNYDIYDVNESDVYNSTRKLSEMKGKISQAISDLKSFNKFYIEISSISLVWFIVCLIMQLLIRR